MPKATAHSGVHTSAAVVTAFSVLLSSLGGCSAAREQIEDDRADEPSTEQQAWTPEPEPGDQAVAIDVNNDGRPNIINHYRVIPNRPEVLLRKDIDLNGNGRIDIWRFYEDGERLLKEAFDLDFSGVIDIWNFYDDRERLIRKEADLTLNQQTDLWKYYENGRLVRKERDTSGDGRANYFEFWEDGKIDRIGEDLNGDGTIDRWTRRDRD